MRTGLNSTLPGVVDIGGPAAVSWDRAHGVASVVAGSLARQGVRPGDVVVAAGETGVETVLLTLAAWRCGAAISLAAGAEAGTAELVERVRATGARVAYVPASDPGDVPPPQAADALLLDRAELHRAGAVQAATTGRHRAPVSWPPTDASPDSIAIVQATSGTTGSKRLVPVTWRMLLANLRAIADRLALDGSDAFASWMPLYHDMGLIAFLALPAFLGGRMTLVPTAAFARAPGSMVDALATTGATMSGTTTLGLALMERALRRRRDRTDLSALQRLVCGAELIDLEIARSLVDAGRPHGLRPDAFSGAYGMAEATLAISIRPPSTVARTADTTLADASADRRHTAWAGRRPHGFARTGPPVAGTEVRVVARAGRGAVGDGEVGEVQVRGSGVFAGYLGMSAEASGLVAGGWLRTGDLGYLADGEVVIVGRSKDILVVGGRKFVPEDVERVVTGLPGVRRAAAVPVRGATGEGFAVVAEAARSAPTTAGEVRAALRRALDVSPEAVHFVAKGEIPKTTSGKLRRRACRDLLPGPRQPAAAAASGGVSA